MFGNKADRPERWEWLAILLIVILAGVLRMGWPALVEFKRDEALLFSMALDVASFEQFHLRGITSSVGFPNFPMSVWLYALPLFISKHVYAPILFTGLLNTLAVFGSWWLVRRYWSSPAALATALMLAVSPWAVFHSQKIWAQNLLTPLVMVWAISAALTFVERRKGFVVLLLLSLAVAIQIHLAGLALVPVTLILLLIYWRRVDWRWLLAGAGLALLTTVPFLYYLNTSATVDIGQIGDISQTVQRDFNLKAWRFAWLLTSGREIHALAGPERFEAYLAEVPDLTLVHLLWGGLVVAGLAWLGRQAWKLRNQPDPQAEMGLIVLVWCLVPALFFMLPLLPVELHYLLPIYPAPYIAAGVAFSLILVRIGRWAWAGWGVLGLSALAQAAVWLALLNVVGNTSTPGGYGTPIRYRLQAAERARSLLEVIGGEEILIAGRGEDPKKDPFSAVYDVLLRDVPHRFVDTSRSALFPDDPAVVLLSADAGEQTSNLYLGAADQVTRLPLRQDEGFLQIVAIPAEASPEPDFRPEPTSILANWVNLYGHDALKIREDGTAVWRIYWHPGADPDPNDYHIFNHFLDEQGRLIAQQDAAAFSPGQWRPGDSVVSTFIVPWEGDSSDLRKVRTGMYVYPSLDNVPLLDVAGNPFSDAAEFEVQE